MTAAEVVGTTVVTEEAQELVMSKMAQVLWDASDSFCDEYANELQNAQDVPKVKYDGTHCHKEGNAAAARRSFFVFYIDKR